MKRTGRLNFWTRPSIVGEMSNGAKTHVFEWLARERTLVSVGGQTPYSDGDWDAYLQIAQQLAHEEMRVLAYVGGTLPTRAQQAQLTALPNPRRRRIAVVSQSTAMRFIVSMFVMVVPHIQTFSPDKIEDALAFLQLEPTEAAVVLMTLERLRREVESDERAA